MNPSIRKMLLPSYSLSNDDISQLLECMLPRGCCCPIIKYPELRKIDDILQYLEKYGFVVILFMNGSFNYGHWCCMTVSPYSKDTDEMSINFFDSYGIAPDSQKDYIDNNFLELSDQDRNYLSELLLLISDNYNIEYQEKNLQKKKKGNNTCGRWVVCRILTKDIPLNKFQKIMNNGKFTPDQKVVKMTNLLMSGALEHSELIGLFDDESSCDESD